jgi:hypothetical protein
LILHSDFGQLGCAYIIRHAEGLVVVRESETGGHTKGVARRMRAAIH